MVDDLQFHPVAQDRVQLSYQVVGPVSGEQPAVEPQSDFVGDNVDPVASPDNGSIGRVTEQWFKYLAPAAQQLESQAGQVPAQE